MNQNVIFCLTLAAPALLLTSCTDEPDSDREGASYDAKPTADQPRGRDANEPAEVEAPDNTGINERDRDDATMTPMDQAQNGADIKITAEIRRAVVSDEGVASDAGNVKIISVDGVVTLLGPVTTQLEKSSIEAKAKAVAGVVRVDNQLEVQPQ